MVTTTFETPSGSTGNSARIVLVVEDEEGVRICATEFLRDCGYHVVEAGTVAEAKEMLLRGPVDLVFSDINMPNRETGFALEKWVRRQFPEIKVLLTSGVPQSAEDTGEIFDVAIVGGGLSGLATALYFQQKAPHAKTLVLENHPIFGGEAKRNEFIRKADLGNAQGVRPDCGKLNFVPGARSDVGNIFVAHIVGAGKRATIDFAVR